ncbi:MAG: sigma-54-dependent Fis family transcriptional regulator [Polyangiaceae bacterium]
MSSRLSLLVDLASMLAREVDLDALLDAACARIAAALHAERATVWLVDADAGDLVAKVAVLPEPSVLRQPMGKGISGWVAETGEIVRASRATDHARFDPTIDKTTGFVTRSMVTVPIREDRTAPVRGVLQVLNRSDGDFDEEDEKYVVALAAQLGRALALTTLRAADRGSPGVTLRGPFNRIIGTSAELGEVYERARLAAQTDATVLFVGETGTGKGLFARAIHVNSSRQAGPFVTVDCTTLPAQLVESMLFGHERGAFTGADRRVAGKLEIAEGGTLFLDEIGDLPLEMQGKLLRLLQDRAYERIGGRATLTANVRFVCATHRDLRAAVARGAFREDLYYRVRVVEIELPPLRARGGDEIERLAKHFADVYAKRYARPDPTFSPEAIERLRAHDWPGNVRELEHWIESALVLSPTGRIDLRHVPIGDGPAREAQAESALAAGLTLAEAERRYARATLAAANGNRTEAAKRLGIGRNTLARILGDGAKRGRTRLRASGNNWRIRPTLHPRGRRYSPPQNSPTIPSSSRLGRGAHRRPRCSHLFPDAP